VAGTQARSLDAVTARQLELLERMSALDPPLRVIGGFAEDALLAGSVTRPHVDVDWLIPRRECDLRLEQASELGFAELEVWGESAPGEPFYLYGESGDLKLEIGVADEEDGALWIKVWAISFEVDGKPAPVGYRLELPSDTFRHPRVEIDGITVWPASPLALYQFRVGIARQGSFGELGEKQLRAMHDLKNRFFPDRTEADLMPRIERLTVPSVSSGGSAVALRCQSDHMTGTRKTATSV
jgi:hypothetical protein